jgi:hypothetical protein
MTLLTVAELLAGEALVTPGGPVDRTTAVGDDDLLWSMPLAEVIAPHSHAAVAAVPRQLELASV